MRHGLLHVTLDVPTDDQFLAWAHAAYKPLGGHITFFETNRLTARETVSFAADHCVSYQETFQAGDGEVEAYVCQLTITSERLVLTPGGPARAFVAPAAREYAAAVITKLFRKWLAPVRRLAAVRPVGAKTANEARFFNPAADRSDGGEPSDRETTS